MAAHAFSAFRRYQLIFELRYSEAYLLWDRAGTVSTQISRLFKIFRNSGATPNQVTFNADDRYTLAVMLDKASITDNKPQGSLDSTIEIFAAFGDAVSSTLGIQVFTRLGSRHLYAIDCKSLKEAHERARAATPKSVPKKELFAMKPDSVYPTFKVEADDGQLGYTAQLYAREQILDFNPPPDALAVGLDKFDKHIFQLILDFDLYTKRPIPRESFDTQSWLTGFNKMIARDADAFLDLAGGASDARA